MKSFPLYIVAILTFSACLNEPQLPALTDNYLISETIELAVADEISISEENIHIKFLKVRDESRCPEAWKCLWGGEAEIELQFQKGEYSQNVRLKYEGGNCTTCGNDVTVFGYKVKLNELTPYPDEHFYAKRPLNFDDYKVTIEVTNDESEIYS